MKSDVQFELEDIYKELDKEIGLHKIGCNACGTCCNFRRFDHVLFASIIEVEYIIDNLESPLSRLDDGICPFQYANKCTVRKYRTLGCRVFYCDKTYKKDFASDIYNKCYRKIKELSMKCQKGWEYKPFLEHLGGYLVNPVR